MKLKDHLYYSEKGIRLYSADCLDVMRKLPDDYADLVVTDPPYGYSFMGKDWDKVIIPVSHWKECLRVLKPGAFAFVMSAPRQDVLSRMIYNLQEAGFETGFSSIYWTYASGFPKASNISKMIDKRLGKKRKIIGKKVRGNVEEAKKRGTTFTQAEANKNNKAIFGYGIEKITLPSSKKAKELDGSYGGFQPKPAVEIIIVAMKPLSEKSYIDQALKNGKGITWLDSCRVPYKSEETPSIGGRHKIKGRRIGAGSEKYGFESLKNALVSNKGRFPANLLVSSDVFASKQDKGTKPHKVQSNKDKYEGWGTITKKSGEIVNYGDKGSYSRYFSLDSWWAERIKKLPPEVQKVFPYLIVPKASKSEKNKGCENLNAKIQKTTGKGIDNTIRRCPIHNECIPSGYRTYKCGCEVKYLDKDFDKPKKNYHPTVKPIKLMGYLITLGSRENDIILDPFAGSGTTLIASKILNRKGIGIELSKEYCEIAKHRIKGN